MWGAQLISRCSISSIHELRSSLFTKSLNYQQTFNQCTWTNFIQNKLLALKTEWNQLGRGNTVISPEHSWWVRQRFEYCSRWTVIFRQAFPKQLVTLLMFYELKEFTQSLFFRSPTQWNQRKKCFSSGNNSCWKLRAPRTEESPWH